MSDNLDKYPAFRNLDDEAQARVRASVAVKRMPTAENRFLPAVSEGLSAIIAGIPPEVDKELLAKHENVDRLAESIVARWYASAGSKYRALYLLYGADEMIRHIVKKALDAYPAGIDAKPDELIVFSTSQPGDYWKITSVEALEMAMRLLELDLHCDLDLFKGTDQDLCMKDAAWRASICVI